MLERFDVLCRRCPARKEYEKAAIGEGRIFKKGLLKAQNLINRIATPINNRVIGIRHS
jgi:hypothetical protein